MKLLKLPATEIIAAETVTADAAPSLPTYCRVAAISYPGMAAALQEGYATAKMRTAARIGHTSRSNGRLSRD